MSLPLHVLPTTRYDDKLKKSFIHQLSLHVELNRELSSTVSPPHIVIFRPQGRPNDEFDGVVLHFLDKYNPSCGDFILFTAFAIPQRYDRGFRPACELRFRHRGKLLITSGHLDTQVNRDTFKTLGHILVDKYGFKISEDQSKIGRDVGSLHLVSGKDMEKTSKQYTHDHKGNSTGSDDNNLCYNNKSTVCDANSQVYNENPTVSDASSQTDNDNATVRDASNQTDKDNPTVSDASSQTDNDNPTVSDASNQTDNDNATVRDASNQTDKDNPTVSDASNQTDNDNPTVSDASNQTDKDNPTVCDASNQTDKDSTTVSDTSNQTDNDNTTVSDTSNQTDNDNPTVSDASNQTDNKPNVSDASNQTDKDNATVRDASNQTDKDNPTVSDTSNHTDKDNPTVSDASIQTDKDNPTVSDKSNHTDKDSLSVSDANNQTDKDSTTVSDASNQTDKDNQPVSDASNHTDKDNQPVSDASNQENKQYPTVSDASNQTDKDNQPVSDASNQEDQQNPTVSDATNQEDKQNPTVSGARNQTDMDSPTASYPSNHMAKGKLMVIDAREQENKDKDNGGVGGARQQADKDNGGVGGARQQADKDNGGVGGARQQADKDNGGVGGARQQAGKDNCGVGGARQQAGKGNQDNINGGDRQHEDIFWLQKIQEEVKTETTALQEKVETQFKLPPGKLNQILDEVLKYLDQEEKAAATSEISERHILQSIQEGIDKETTVLQGNVETKFKLPPGTLFRIFDEVLQSLNQEQESAVTSEIQGKFPPLLGDDMASKIENQPWMDKGSLNKIIQALLKSYVEKTNKQCTQGHKGISMCGNVKRHANSLEDNEDSTGSHANSQVDQGNSTGSDAKSQGDNIAGVTVRLHGGDEPVVSHDHTRNTSRRNVPPLGAEMQESGSNSCCPPHCGPGCDQNLDKLRTILEEMKTKTTDLQRAVEKKCKLPPGKLPDILDEVLKCQQNQAPKAAGMSEIWGRSPPLLGDDLASKTEKQLGLKTGSLHEIIDAVLKFSPKKKWWQFWKSDDAST